MSRTRPHRKQPSLGLQVTEYLISGGVYFWVGYGAFFALDRGAHLSLLWAKTLANVIGWGVNFGLQRYWVFKDSSAPRHRTEVTFRYAAITLFDFALDYVIVASLKNAGISPYLGQFVSAGFFTVWNFAWYRLWVFGNRVHRHHPRRTHRKRRPA